MLEAFVAAFTGFGFMLLCQGQAAAARQMENLGRGLVAIRQSDGCTRMDADSPTRGDTNCTN